VKKPNFFIVGAPKCGTTAMNEYLKQHPEIFIPEKKELHFFGTDLKFYTPGPTEEKYLSYFSSVTTEKRVGEATVWYLYSKQAASEIKKYCPSARIIIMLRNPVHMLHSLHSQFLFEGYENIMEFKCALDAEANRKRGLCIPDSARLKNRFFCKELLFYREVAKYEQQVRRYLDVFGRENVHVIIFDDFESDTAGVYRETCRFLGVTEAFQSTLKVANPNRRIRNMTLHEFLRYPPNVVRWVGKLTPSQLRRGLRQSLWNFNIQHKPRPLMDPRLKRLLQAEFALDVERLSTLLDRDLTHWSKN
jgi:hypothetical protein